MSMYNMVLGTHPEAGVVLTLLQIPKNKLGRVRDAWVERQADDSLLLAVYTRNGGGNRGHYDSVTPEGSDCGCTGCIMKYVIPQLPLYVRDEDDSYDATYATVYFKVPEDSRERLKALGAPEEFTVETIARPKPNMKEMWENAIKDISKRVRAVTTSDIGVEFFKDDRVKMTEGYKVEMMHGCTREKHLGPFIEEQDNLCMNCSIDHLDEFGECLGAVEGLHDYNNKGEEHDLNKVGPELDVCWAPSGLHYAYHPNDLEKVP